MGMRISFGLVAACGSFALLSSACGTAGNDSAEGQASAVEQKSIYLPPPVGDTLAVHAARCDAATGIHVPAFSCSAGLAGPSGNHFAWIDQKSSIDAVKNVDGLVAVGTSVGTRTPDVPATTAKRMSSTGANISGTADNFHFAFAPMGSTSGEVGGANHGQAEVKIVSYASSSSGALAGLMMRTVDGTLDPSVTQNILDKDSPHAMLAITPAGDVKFLHRATKAGATQTLATVAAQGFPLWLRLTWESNVGVKAEISRDHTPGSWQTVGVTPAFSSPIYVDAGVAVAAATVNYDRFYTTMRCDSPSALGVSCDLNSSFQVLARTADAIAVANCRAQAHVAANAYDDVAVLQYNRKNGALCFYQSFGVNGSSVTAPSDTSSSYPWLTPTETHTGNCTGCHDTGGLIRSPYLKQTGLLPNWGEGYNNDGQNPLTYVGTDYQNDRSFTVSASRATSDTGIGCGSCHDMAVNNVKVDGGTTQRFGRQATSENQIDENDIFAVSHKNPVSATSPLWMRPSSVLPDRTYPTQFDQGAADTAAIFKSCGALLRDNGFDTNIDNWADKPPAELGCSYGTRGVPYASPIQILEDVTWGSGGGSSSGTLDNVTIDSASHTDIYNNTDTGLFAQTLVAPGDGTAMVKVTSLKLSNEYAKAGLMFRSDNSASAANVMVAFTAQHGVTFQYRPTAGAATPPPAFLSSVTTLPVWLRLDRSGETFVGSVSTDNRATWQQVGQAVTLPGYSGSPVGLVNTSHTNSAVPGQATFEAFDFTTGAGWAAPQDPHLLVDAKVGAGATGSRTEWITREYMHAGGSSGGGDIQNNADKFMYSFKTFATNGELLTTVESITSTAQYGKAGLMVRNDIGEAAKNVFVARTPGGVTFQSRTATGGSTAVNNVSTANQSTDLRLVRSGLTYTGYYKAHGASTWIQLGTVTFSSFNSQALTGLAVSTQTTTATTDAVFYSGKIVEPPGFLWPAMTPDPDPQPTPGMHPCEGLCAPSPAFTWSGNNYQSGQLGTGAVCMETTHALAGGNCSNLFNGRQFLLNNTAQTCNGQNWSTLPAPRNGGYCIALTPGSRQDAAFALW